MQESIVFLVRVKCRRKGSSRSLSHLLMSFLLRILRPYTLTHDQKLSDRPGLSRCTHSLSHRKALSKLASRSGLTIITLMTQTLAEYTYWYTQCHRVDWQPKQYAFWLLEIYLLPYWHKSFKQLITSPHCNSSQYCYNN